MTEAVDTRGDTRARIVDAAARLLREGGAAAVTTRGVADAAGVQAPAIYRLFGDKDGLLDAVAEHVLATYVSAKSATVDALVEGSDPVDDLRSGWNTQLEFGLANPVLATLLADPVRAQRSPAARAGMEVLARRVHRIARAGRLCVSEARAVALVHAAGTGAVLTLLATPPAERDLAVADDLFDAVLDRILLETPGPAPTADRTAPVVALRALAPELAVLSPGERRLLVEWLDRVVGA